MSESSQGSSKTESPKEGQNKDMSGALRGVPAKGVGAYLPANSAVGGVAPSQKN